MSPDVDVRHQTTFCRICEALCGMVATVEDGRLVALRPDKENPTSRGFACQKGIAFVEVHNDPDRVTTPLRRSGDGFEPISWDAAMDDICARLDDIHRRHGSGALGWYYGNPGAFSHALMMSMGMFITAFGQKLHVFTAGSQDVNNRFVASQLLYGTPFCTPIPDIPRNDFLVVMGANPVVSHGSAITMPRIRDGMNDIVKRGGRVLVIDPRRTETAAQFEWMGIRPDSDAFLLLSMLNVMFSEGLDDRELLERQADGVGWLKDLAAPFTPEVTATHTGIDPETVRLLARELAATPRAAIYGRIGTSVCRSGTLTAYLMDAVNLVAGNVDRVGGSMFGRWGLPAERWLMKGVGAMLCGVYERRRSRIGGFRSVMGSEPAALMAKEITTAGPGQIKALLVSAGNPVLSVPNGVELEKALDTLELMVGIDIYVNETNAHCDYILPATTMYERDDYPMSFQGVQPTPMRQATEAVVEPVGEARLEWEVINEITRRLWRRTPALVVLHGLRKTLHAFGLRLTPRMVASTVIRISEGGDWFGLRRGGLSFDRLTQSHPHGAVIAPNLRAGVLRDSVMHRGRRIHLQHDDIRDEVAAMAHRSQPADYPMRLIGMRESRSENTWMHNAPLLMRGEHRHRAVVNVDDAAALQLAEGDVVRVTSEHGEINVPVRLTKDILPGVIAIPHGWGHNGRGSWRTANENGGANVNQLMSSKAEDLEPLAGMAWLTGVPVRLTKIEAGSVQPSTG